MSTRVDIRGKTVSRVRDDTGKLINPDDYDRCIDEAVRKYSKVRPKAAALEVTGDGGSDYSLPSDWEEGVSYILGIEYPVGNVPADELEAEDWTIYTGPSGDVIRLQNDAPPASETFLVRYTTLRAVTEIPSGDTDAVVNLAASLCCEELANIFAQTSDSTMSVDSVDYRSKSSEFASRAKRLLAMYGDQVGERGDGGVSPASATKDVDRNYPWGGDRLTHKRRYR